MAPKPRDNPQTDADCDRQPRRNVAIGRRALHRLGQPAALLRVDVVVGPDAGSARIAHSYFLIADGAGSVRAFTPTLSRRY
jgi:hypothetical protein